MNQETPDSSSLRSLLIRGSVSATPWFAVLDAAQDETLPARASDSRLRTESLYAGRVGSTLSDVAPHLASFDLNNPFADWLFENWGGNYGILLQSKATFEEVRDHFRKFLIVRDEADKKYRFRFYDPRVLRAFLPACSPEEAKAFFGPVNCFYVPDRFARTVLAFGWSPRGLTIRDLGETKAPAATK